MDTVKAIQLTESITLDMIAVAQDVDDMHDEPEFGVSEFNMAYLDAVIRNANKLREMIKAAA